MSGLVLTTTLGLLLGYHTLEKSINRYRLQLVDLTVSSSKYLSPNEDENIVLGMENNDQNKVDAEFRLEHTGLTTAHIGMDASNAFYVGPILRQEQLNRELKVNFPCTIRGAFATLGQKAGLSLWGAAGQKPIEKISDLPLMVGPIPWARKIFTLVCTAWVALVGFLVTGLWWERVKTAGQR